MNKIVYHMNTKYEYSKSFQIELQKNSTCTLYVAHIYKNIITDITHSELCDIIHTELFPFDCFYSYDGLINRIEEVLLKSKEFDCAKIYLNNIII